MNSELLDEAAKPVQDEFDELQRWLAVEEKEEL
jgi:hypothetical protein